MTTEALELTIRTPHETVFSGPVLGLRVPTETGLVGLRPRAEPAVMAVETGLIVVRAVAQTTLVATAGGLLQVDRERCTILTPFAAVGDSAAALEETLQALQTTPPAELLARRRLEELEQNILGELSGHPAGRSPGVRHG